MFFKTVLVSSLLVSVHCQILAPTSCGCGQPLLPYSQGFPPPIAPAALPYPCDGPFFGYANPLLPAASPVSAMAPPVSPYLPPALPCGCRCQYLKKIPIPPPCI